MPELAVILGASLAVYCAVRLFGRLLMSITSLVLLVIAGAVVFAIALLGLIGIVEALVIRPLHRRRERDNNVVAFRRPS